MKPGSFDPSRHLEALVEGVKAKLMVKELPISELVEENRRKIQDLFDRYEELRINPAREEQPEQK